MTKEELIEIVRRIADCNGSEAEIDAMMQLLKKNVPHPSVLNLIFWADEELTPQQIVERALAYKPIAL